MDLHAFFQRASELAEGGEFARSAEEYRSFLDRVRAPGSTIPASQRPSLVRSAAFNLAQVLNKSKDYESALRYVELGLSCSPTDFGRAIAYSAKGEALCGMGRHADGQAAFEEAFLAHAIVGRLNSADSMSRLGSDGYLRQAEDLVVTVKRDFGPMLDRNLQAEALNILGKIAVGRGDRDGARKRFKEVLRDYPDASNGCVDARLQLRLLEEMTLKWRCTGCGKPLSAPAQRAGGRCKCPDCGTPQPVPSRSREQIQPDAAAAPTRAPTNRTPTWKTVSVAIGGIALLALAVHFALKLRSAQTIGNAQPPSAATGLAHVDAPQSETDLNLPTTRKPEQGATANPHEELSRPALPNTAESQSQSILQTHSPIETAATDQTPQPLETVTVANGSPAHTTESDLLSAYFPLRVGAKWTYRIELLDGAPSKYVCLSNSEQPNAGFGMLLKLDPIRSDNREVNLSIRITERLPTVPQLDHDKRLNEAWEFAVDVDDLKYYQSKVSTPRYFFATSRTPEADSAEAEDMRVTPVEEITFDAQDRPSSLSQYPHQRRMVMFVPSSLGELAAWESASMTAHGERIEFLDVDDGVVGHEGQQCLHFRRYKDFHEDGKREYSEDLWFAKGKGLVHFVQEVDGNVSMRWTLVDFK